MQNGQSYAVDLEFTLRNIFGYERFGFGGVVNSDFIRKNPFATMICGLSFIYATADGTKRKAIDDFIDYHSFYSEMSIDTLLSFESNEKVINGITIQLEFDNGQLALEDMIEKFNQVVKN